MNGISKNGNYLRIQFTWNNKRYRPTTTHKVGQEKQAAKLLAAILFDLENNRFKIDIYKNQLQRASSLSELDDSCIDNLNNPLLQELLTEHLLILNNKLNSGIIQASTHRGYCYTITTHLMPRLGKYKVSEINVQIIEEFINSLGLTKKRLKVILRPLTEIFQRLLRHNKITKNPFLDLNRDSFTNISISDYEVNPFNQEEINLILSNCDHECVRNFIQFGFWTGCRISEIFALNWDDIDFKKETISINKSQTLNRQLKPPKTKSGIRKIEMTPKAKEALQAQYLLTADKERVFLTPTNKIWSKPDNFGRYWKVALSKAKVTYRNPYQMRHTFISMMLHFGNSPLDLYKIVGHDNTEMIYKNYARFIKQDKDKKLLKTS